MLKSHIRESQKIELADRFRKKNFSKYLLALEIENLRVFKSATIRFDYPITAIIGANGSGKSTAMMAAGCVYKEIKPSSFFAKSSFDAGLQKANVKFTLIDKKIDTKNELKTSISHKGLRWDRKQVFERSVKYFGVSRTVPPTEKSDLAILRNKKVKPTQTTPLSENEIKHIRRILGFDSNYEYCNFDISKNLFVGTREESTYSEFHFGAGESSIARLVYELERLDDYSLVLIEELENGLHPLAVIRLVEYLFEVCLRKKHQVIFTTHSNYAIQNLPNDAIWYCMKGQIVQGKMDIEALRVLQGEIDKQLVVFVEDEFAKIFLETLLRQFGKMDLLDLLDIYKIGGKNEIISYVNSQNRNPAIKVAAVGVLDGDVLESDYNKTEHKDKFAKLPTDGRSPEIEVWGNVVENLDSLIARITVKLGLAIGQQEFVREKILDTQREVLDTHILFSTLADKLGLMAEVAVIGAFISSYTEIQNGKLRYLVDFLEGNVKT